MKEPHICTLFALWMAIAGIFCGVMLHVTANCTSGLAVVSACSGVIFLGVWKFPMEFPQPQKSITENFLEAIDKHAPLKKKFVRGNQAPFMNREFQKAI